MNVRVRPTSVSSHTIKLKNLKNCEEQYKKYHMQGKRYCIAPGKMIHTPFGLLTEFDEISPAWLQYGTQGLGMKVLKKYIERGDIMEMPQ